MFHADISCFRSTMWLKHSLNYLSCPRFKILYLHQFYRIRCPSSIGITSVEYFSSRGRFLQDMVLKSNGMVIRTQEMTSYFLDAWNTLLAKLRFAKNTNVWFKQIMICDHLFMMSFFLIFEIWNSINGILLWMYHAGHHKTGNLSEIAWHYKQIQREKVYIGVHVA